MGGILAAIAAGPRPVEVPTVQDLQARNMQLQAMAQQGMLRQQEAALTGMKMQEAQLDFAERNALMGGMQRAIADPSNKAADGSQDWNKTYSALQTDPEVTANSRPQTLSGLRSAWLSQQKEMQEYSKSVADQKRIESETAAKNQEIAEKGRDIIGNWAQGQIDKGETSAPVVAAYLLRHRTEFPDGQNEIDAELNALQKNPDQAPAILQDWAQGRSAAAVEAYSKAQTGEAAAGLAKAQEDLRQYEMLPKNPETGLAFNEPFAQFVRSRNLTNAPATDTPQFAAGLRRAGYTPEQRIQAMQADLMQQALQGGGGVAQTDNIIRQSLPDNKPLAEAYVNEYHAGLLKDPLNAAKEVLGKIAAAKQAPVQAAATETATMGPKIQTAVGTKVGTEQAGAALDIPELRGITDSGRRSQIFTDLNKARTEFASNQSDVAGLKDYLNLARSGNEAAGDLAVIKNLRTIVSRVTQQEINAGGGNVSIARRVANAFSKATSGVPASGTLDDLEKLADASASRAATKFNTLIDPWNKAGASIARVPVPSIGGGGGGGGGVRQIIVTDANGKQHPFNSEHAAQVFEQIVKQHGGSTTRQ